MNKNDLIDAVEKKTNLSKKDCKNAVEVTLGTIKKNVKNGVQIVGFGSFKVVRRKGRKGRNPRTGEPITIKAKNVVKFTPGKEFKSAVA